MRIELLSLYDVLLTKHQLHESGSNAWQRSTKTICNLIGMFHSRDKLASSSACGKGINLGLGVDNLSVVGLGQVSSLILALWSCVYISVICSALWSCACLPVLRVIKWLLLSFMVKCMLGLVDNTELCGHVFVSVWYVLLCGHVHACQFWES